MWAESEKREELNSNFKLVSTQLIWLYYCHQIAYSLSYFFYAEFRVLSCEIKPISVNGDIISHFSYITFYCIESPQSIYRATYIQIMSSLSQSFSETPTGLSRGGGFGGGGGGTRTSGFSHSTASGPATMAPHSSSRHPHHEDFFSIDDILACHQRVPCQFELPVYRLGFLNPNSSDEHLQVGTKMEIPLWLARMLCSRRRQIVSVGLPKAYREAQRDILSADANIVDLYKLGPYYYSMGVKLLRFEHLERADLSKSLLETFLNRFRWIMDSSQNAFQSDTSSLMSKLDEKERELFRTGQRAVQDMERWERGESHKITSSSVVQNRRKRKREPSE